MIDAKKARAQIDTLREAIRLAQKIPPCALRQRGDSPGKRVDGGG